MGVLALHHNFYFDSGCEIPESKYIMIVSTRGVHSMLSPRDANCARILLQDPMMLCEGPTQVVRNFDLKNPLDFVQMLDYKSSSSTVASCQIYGHQG